MKRATPISLIAAFGLAVSGSLASGCHHVAPPPSQFPNAAAALARMKATYQCERGMKGEAKIDSFSERGRIRGKVLLFASRPSRLRFDLLSPPPFNSIISTLTTDDGHFALMDVRERKFYEGPASACNIARLTEVPLEAHTLVSLLGGQAPVLVHRDSDLQLEWSSDGYYLVRIPSTRGAFEELHLTPTPADFQRPWSSQRLRVLDVRVAQQGIELYHASLDAHEWTSTAPAQVDPDGIDPPIPPSGPPCTVEVPRKIHIEVKEGGQDVLFRYDDVKVNPPLPPGVFAQPVPSGIGRVHVDCDN
jgi:outer membrane lipoprotein-sorting protein